MSVEPDAGAFRPPRFDVERSDEPDGRLLLRLSGELDLMSEPRLGSALADGTGRTITIDVSDLAFMDSTGLRALLGAARDHPGLQLRGPLHPSVRRLLDLTQTLAILPFEDQPAP